MNKDQERAWKKAEKEAHAERKRLLEKTRAEVLALLEKAKADITLTLAGQPTEYQQWRLSELNREVDRVTAEIGRSAGQVLASAAIQAWEGGIAALDKSLAAAKFQVMLPHLDAGQLMGMRAFMVERIADVTAVAAGKIKQELGLAMIGTQSVHETIGKVAGHLGEGSRTRATTIVRTELSRAWAVAADERAVQSGQAGVAMDKIWRRSGKLHPRRAHLLADGRRVKLDETFTINGHPMRFPHDPRAPASETINCGCICLYRPRETPGTLPDHRPFTEQEIAQNPDMAQLADGKSVRELLGDTRTLPNHENASIGIRKLRDYALDSTHPVGGNKARRILATLGFDASDASQVSQLIRDGLRSNSATPGLLDEHGQRYSVDMELTGPSGTAIVRTAWIADSEDAAPRLVSFYVKGS